jgi:hypothetical protein
VTAVTGDQLRVRPDQRGGWRYPPIAPCGPTYLLKRPLRSVATDTPRQTPLPLDLSTSQGFGTGVLGWCARRLFNAGADLSIFRLSV